MIYIIIITFIQIFLYFSTFTLVLLFCYYAQFWGEYRHQPLKFEYSPNYSLTVNLENLNDLEKNNEYIVGFFFSKMPVGFPERLHKYALPCIMLEKNSCTLKTLYNLDHYSDFFRIQISTVPSVLILFWF